MKKILTLCIPVRENEVLLGMKKRGFGVGWWNGFGGKVEAGETFEEGVARELAEEAGIRDGVLARCGILEFSFQHDATLLEVHVFQLTNFTDTSRETEEMRPQWFLVEDIPFAQMWPDDRYWFPLLLQGQCFKGAFYFDKPSDAEYSSKILQQTLRVVTSLAE